MRIIFMGSPDFAVPALNALVEAGHEVIAVYCQPPRPAGRGKADRKTAVHERAEQLGLEVRTPRTLRNEEEQARFTALDADLAVVAAYGLILPKPILDAPKMGCVNIHASLLPRWRGAAPIQRAILAGDKETGITLMQMDEGLDTGPILLDWPLEIDGKTAGQVTEELALLGGQALWRWLAEPARYPPRPQPEDGATYASKLDKSEAQLDFTRDADAVERQVRAFNPPGAWFEFLGERIKVLLAEVVPGGGPSGVVADDHLKIACAERAVRPLIVQRAGRTRMNPDELLRGFPIPKGSRLNQEEPGNS
ncbi:methionyl-tRNA formyltransferase [Sphingomonas daechungensis]|uniref:Methionyl-tRNA formyltransferase n=1 Tax=Sphingomonas daechungensis TaxID=1176646 RepID=A0ABX6T4C2_9SPHN|nr:methionyl-tRNA formyltransferase [Sphingomonas daechungensis]QNP42498.1 methionyl-tRNA formyltransferase [Sphingomonas daechungensis]